MRIDLISLKFFQVCRFFRRFDTFVLLRHTIVHMLLHLHGAWIFAFWDSPENASEQLTLVETLCSYVRTYPYRNKDRASPLGELERKLSLFCIVW
jgi:hypothetical protein